MLPFIDIRIVDILDILLSAYLMYAIYRLIKGTIAAHIVLSVMAFLVIFVIVRALGMSMLSAVMGSFVNIGLLALIVIFQQEIRSFLILLSTKHTIFKRFGIDKYINKTPQTNTILLTSITKACETMAQTKTGALIVIARHIGLKNYIQTGEQLNAQPSQQLIETIFFKNTPLHDGAMIITANHITAAGCILPVSKNMELPKNYGLRHRSAAGITEITDAIAIVVSEETGTITIFEQGQHLPMDTPQDLYEYLRGI